MNHGGNVLLCVLRINLLCCHVASERKCVCVCVLVLMHNRKSWVMLNGILILTYKLNISLLTSLIETEITFFNTYCERVIISFVLVFILGG